MNLKKFISDNIIDVGTNESDKGTPVENKAPTTSNHDNSSPHKDVAATRSFINRQNSMDSGDAKTSISNTELVSSDALNEARNQIAKVMADNNRPGTDYYEFVLTKNAMSSIPVEAERYKVAFAGLSATGLTKENINSSGLFYKTLVGNELKNFQEQFGQVYKSDVLDKKDAIAEKQKQMVQLSEQINRLNEEIKKMSDEVQQDETTFLMKKNAFEQAVAEAQNNIQTELNKIDQYIQ